MVEDPAAGEEGGGDPSMAPRLSTRAYDRLLGMLRSGELKAGAIVQERRLAKALDVSRTPLRDALSRLEGEGLLTRHGERMLQVTPFSLEDYGQALRVRLLLEVEAVRLAAGHVPAGGLAEVRAQLSRLSAAQDGERSCTQGDLDAVDDAIHELVADASGNPLLAELIRLVRRRSRLFGLENRPQRIREIVVEHAAILDALAAGDADGAGEAMQTHLLRVLESLKDRLSGHRSLHR